MKRCDHESEKGSLCRLRPGHIRQDLTAHADAEGRAWDDDGLIQDHWPRQRHPSVPVCDKCHGWGTLGSRDPGRCGSTHNGMRCMFPEGHESGHWWSDGKASASWIGSDDYGVVPT